MARSAEYSKFMQSFVSPSDKETNGVSEESTSESPVQLKKQLNCGALLRDQRKNGANKTSYVSTSHSNNCEEVEYAEESRSPEDDDWYLSDSAVAQLAKHDVFTRPKEFKPLKVTNSIVSEKLLDAMFKNDEICSPYKGPGASKFILDKDTKFQLYKIVNMQVLEKVNTIINVGKRTVVLHALGKNEFPKECAVKVFRINLTAKQPKNKSIPNRLEKQTHMMMLCDQAEREMRTLVKTRKAGIACPLVILLRRHILVTSFIGKDCCPAPTIANANLTIDELQMAHNQIVDIMKTLYRKLHLVHTNLSASNILWKDNKCYITKMSVVDSTYKHAHCYLAKACESFSRFFMHFLGIKILPEDMYLEVAGSSCPSVIETEAWLQIKKIIEHNRWAQYYYEDVCFFEDERECKRLIS